MVIIILFQIFKWNIYNIRFFIRILIFNKTLVHNSLNIIIKRIVYIYNCINNMTYYIIFYNLSSSY